MDNEGYEKRKPERDVCEFALGRYGDMTGEQRVMGRFERRVIAGIIII